ncbi:MAG: PKD domain-containing protein [Bacteroidales bacterium]|nr:PKD domain-containing protein [Bacteroidales bacterium]
MKKLYLIILFICITLIKSNLIFSQNISGIINPSQNVIEIDYCKNSVIVPSTVGFSISNKVLLIQMMGAIIDTTNTPNSGSILNYGNAGNYEFAVISNIVGNEIFFRDSIQRTYNVNDRVQIVKAAVYNNVTVNDTLTCLPWNGLYGGILLLEVSGTLTLNAPIDVSNKGFLGGEKFVVSGACNTIEPNYVMGSIYIRPKGEGIANLSMGQRGGIAPMGNGGGGSGGQVAMATQTDAWYMGGGGGGNGGVGGRGGKSSTFCTIRWEGGLGGKSLTYTPLDNKIFMAGGGGVGHHRYTTSGNESGTNGGGTVIIKANNLVCNNKTIFSNALDVPDTLYNVGRSGGGAGGTIVLEVQNYVGNLNVVARGGKGGDNSGPSLVGPGGGGGGGAVWVNQATFPTNINVNLSGGSNGVHTANNNPWGSTSGTAGTVFTGLSLLQTSNATFVPAAQAANVLTNSPICEGDNIMLTASSVPPNVTYVWSGPNNFTSNAQNPTIPNADTLNAGTYSLSLIINGCPGPLTTANVYVGQYPNAPTTINDTTCFGSPNPGLTANGIDLKWYGNSNLTTLLSTDSIYYPTVTNIGTYTFYVTQSDSLCESSYAEIKLTILPSITVPPVPNQSICSGTPVQPFIANGNGIFTWYSDSLLTNVIAVNDTFIPNVTAPGTYNYYLMVYDTVLLCPSQPQHIVLEIYPMPLALASNDTSICIGTSATLNVNYNNSVPTTISWSNGYNTPQITTTPLSDVTYYVSIENICGIAEDSVKVFVNPLPVTSTSPDTSVCGGEPVNLSASGGNSYIWSNNAGNSASVIVTPISSTTYTVTVTDNNSCSQIDSVHIFVISHPIADAGIDTGICIGSSLQLNATGGLNYIWNTGDTIPNITVTPNSNSLYSVTVTDNFNCSSKDSVMVQVWSLPTAFAGNDILLCIGNIDTLNATGGVSYLWSPSTGLSNPASGNPIITPTSTITYTVIVSDIHSCSASDDVIVSVYPPPQVIFSASAYSGCDPMSVNFTDLTNAQIVSWEWEFGDNASSNNTSNIQNPTHLYQQSGNYTVSLTITTTDGCEVTSSINDFITIYPKPEAAFNFYPLNGTTEDPMINFFDASTNATRWFWNFGDYASENNNFSIDQNTSHSFSREGDYTITLHVESQNGCIDSTSENIKIVPEYALFIPNAFTPDGDGLNDYFNVYGSNIVEVRMTIFNRWGDLIFETDDMNNPWDGHSEVDNEVFMQDTYSYRIIVKDYFGKKHYYNGQVNLIH